MRMSGDWLLILTSATTTMKLVCRFQDDHSEGESASITKETGAGKKECRSKRQSIQSHGIPKREKGFGTGKR